MFRLLLPRHHTPGTWGRISSPAAWARVDRLLSQKRFCDDRVSFTSDRAVAKDRESEDLAPPSPIPAILTLTPSKTLAVPRCLRTLGTTKVFCRDLNKPQATYMERLLPRSQVTGGAFFPLPQEVLTNHLIIRGTFQVNGG